MINRLMQTKMIDKVVELITASLSLISALAWNSAFQKTIDEYPSLKKSGPWVYAIIITAFSVIAITSLSHLKRNVKDIIIENIEKIPSLIYLIIGSYVIYLIYTNFNSNKNENEKENKKENKKNNDNKKAKQLLSALR